MLGYDADLPTATEWAIIRKYRQLDDFGKKATDAILEIEYDRVVREYEKKQKPRMIKLDFYNYPASAGLGNFLDGEKAEELWVEENEKSRRADFVLSISGDSMEPTYHHGDLVLVEKCDFVNEGEIGIFVLNSEAYIKELGAGCLISHNDKYSPIILSETDSVYCCGRVLGITAK